MRMELEGKVDALQKQLTDLDTLRLRHTVSYAIIVQGRTLQNLTAVNT